MSSATQLKPDGRSSLHRPAWAVVALAALLVLLVVGSIQGGWAMVTNPVDPLGMSLDYLERAPVSDYFWPGMFLLGMAAASLTTILGLFGWKWSWAAGIEAALGYRWPWLGALSVGLVLLVFEIIELYLVPFHPVMHPVLIVASLAIVGLPLHPTARAHLKARG